MANWLRRVVGLLPSATTPISPVAETPARSTASVAAPPNVADPAQNTAPPLAELPDPDAPLFDWLLDLSPAMPDAGGTLESRWLAELDHLIAADKGRGELLPRAAGLIPQLLNTLRDDHHSSNELAERITRDANLVAEIMRLANSPAFRQHDPVTDLADAVRRVGTSGVRQAIAKIVLKPMFDAQGGSWSGRAAPRLWQLSQTQADLSRAIAVSREINPFEAYLGGLLGNIGWTAGLRALERVLAQHPAPAHTGFSECFKQGFRLRRDQLFVQFVTAWRLNPALHDAARAVQHAGSLAAADHPLAQVLLAADRLASWHALGRSDDTLWVSGWPDNVRAVYRGLAATG